MAKKIMGQIKLQLPAGSAAPAPPVGPALGQRGLNIMEFVKQFNARSADVEKGTPLPVVITYYQDKSFTFELKTPPVSFFLMKAAKITKGALKPGRERVGSVTMAQCREIAQIKLKHSNAREIDSLARSVAGSALSMGLEVTDRDGAGA